MRFAQITFFAQSGQKSIKNVIIGDNDSNSKNYFDTGCYWFLGNNPVTSLLNNEGFTAVFFRSCTCPLMPRRWL